MASTYPNLILYTGTTPNGIKISIALEELGYVLVLLTYNRCHAPNIPYTATLVLILCLFSLPYKPVKIDMTKTEQKSDWFLRINPNGRVPAVTDTRPPITETSEQRMRLWESGSILLYLTTHYDPQHQISFPARTREYHDMLSWVFSQNAGMHQGQRGIMGDRI